MCDMRITDWKLTICGGINSFFRKMRDRDNGYRYDIANIYRGSLGVDGGSFAGNWSYCITDSSGSVIEIQIVDSIEEAFFKADLALLLAGYIFEEKTITQNIEELGYVD